MSTSPATIMSPMKHPPGSIRELLPIAVPMVISYACDTIMTFTDRVFLSQIGSEEMNASMAGGLSCLMMATFFIGLIGYSTAMVAQYLGAGQKNRCAVVTTQAGILTLLAYPLILLAAPLGILSFELIPLSDAQRQPQILYFNILIYGTIFSLLRSMLNGFFTGIGKTRIVMIAGFAAMGVNIVTNYILIFGKLGFPAMGIRGAAFGTILGGAVSALVMLVAYFRPANVREYNIAKSFRFDAKVMKTILKFGYPAGLEMFLNFLAFVGMILAFHAHGPATATAVTIVFNWDMLSFVPLLGLQVAITSMVGRYMGAGQPDIAHRATMSGLKSSMVYGGGMLLLFVFGAPWLVQLFAPATPSASFAQTAQLATTMLRLAAFYVLADAVIIVFCGALRGAGDTFWTMCISVGLHWALLPIVLITLYVFGLSPITTWGLLVVTLIISGVLFYLRYRSGKWRTIQVVERKTQAELLATDHTQDFHEVRDL